LFRGLLAALSSGQAIKVKLTAAVTAADGKAGRATATIPRLRIPKR
jgi:hypothetical protein